MICVDCSSEAAFYLVWPIIDILQSELANHATLYIGLLDICCQFDDDIATSGVA